MGKDSRASRLTGVADRRFDMLEWEVGGQGLVLDDDVLCRVVLRRHSLVLPLRWVGGRLAAPTCVARDLRCRFCW